MEKVNHWRYLWGPIALIHFLSAPCCLTRNGIWHSSLQCLPHHHGSYTFILWTTQLQPPHALPLLSYFFSVFDHNKKTSTETYLFFMSFLCVLCIARWLQHPWALTRRGWKHSPCSLIDTQAFQTLPNFCDSPLCMQNHWARSTHKWHHSPCRMLLTLWIGLEVILNKHLPHEYEYGVRWCLGIAAHCWDIKYSSAEPSFT